MNLLIVGGSKAGAWQMRGVQLGAALGARVTSAPTADDFGWSDVVVLVKRAGAVYATQAHRANRPIVWDALDFWSQPGDHRLSEAQATALLHAQIRVIQPALTIGATEAMAQACDGAFLPQHAWAGLSPTPARDVVSIVGYEGNPTYLGTWEPAIRRECARLGWTFVINPPDLRLVDLFVAFRDGAWDGWMPREWKSGVKIVNAIAAGRPILTQASAAARELKAVGQSVESPLALGAAFDAWTERPVRDAAEIRGRDDAPAFTLAAVAERYRQILQTLCPAKSVTSSESSISLAPGACC
jgi:hypothetical protein